ncbi:complex I NDUFA9 subunit family protein [Robiginitomaculum antarcticum]|uniref:complex I NDUFA9 subunit family protein n=1 Tax=Robiginitomaculum antarcticum TaxID=437507 RepID=UPI000374776E|nr:complex I NDUFA9 subunit family protein [Robiginitomaculum antarcticum]
MAQRDSGATRARLRGIKMAIETRLVTVFGGSGFVGRYIVRALAARGYRVRVALRRPHTAPDLKVMGRVGQIQLMQANLRFKASIEQAVDGADAVVNCVGLLFESGAQNFKSLHVQGARSIAEAAKAAGITNAVHISAIGADEDSGSDYARTKALGEAAVRGALPGAAILRPSIIFGPEDEFFNKFAKMAQMSPALPLIGGGRTLFQPVYAEDVAKAVTRIITAGSAGQTYELGGPGTYTFKELLAYVLNVIDKKRILVPLPWPVAMAMGFAGELSGALPVITPFLTRDQVTNLKTDNIVGEQAQGFDALGIQPEALEAIVPTYLERYRKYGQFHERLEDIKEN